MSSIVLELQHEALENTNKVSNLLRKALVVARKLEIKEFYTWIENELNGYKTGAESPNYREVMGRILVLDPYRGWIPLLFTNREAELEFSKRNAGQSIAELENLLEKSSDGTFRMSFTYEAQRFLTKDMPFEAEVALFVNQTSIIRIIDKVRTIILNWALKLEEDHILGENLTFSPEDKRQAGAEVHNYVSNIFGNVVHSQVQQGTTNSSQNMVRNELSLEAVNLFIGALSSSLPKLALDADKLEEIKAEMDTIKSQLRSPKPKTSIIKEGLHSIRAILEGAGGVAAGELLIHLGKHFLGG